MSKYIKMSLYLFVLKTVKRVDDNVFLFQNMHLAQNYRNAFDIHDFLEV